ncbi:MAG: stage III sporulation protein AE [Candidatus Choladocola sp.]|nr:stage III sporulation protein AE [Candidatus Choladocola sp.]
MKSIPIILIQLILIGTFCVTAKAEQETEMTEEAVGAYPDPEQMTEEKPEETAEEYLNLTEIQKELEMLTQTEVFSFTDTVKKLITGEIPFHFEDILPFLFSLFFSEMNQMRKTALQILIIVLSSAVFSNFVRMFENSQIADISFYAVYLLISTMLVRCFSTMNQLVSNTCDSVSAFMKVLLPSYLITVVLSSGTVSALGFYEITVLAMNLLQLFIIKIILPSINFYLILLILNQLSMEEYLSRFAELAETVIGWTIQSILGIVLGLQAVQCLIAPAVDSLKNSSLHQLAKSVPGVGSALDAAAETVAGSAVVIKNAVGVAGILALLVICLTPILKLSACILIFRILCAVIQPFSDRRMVDGIDSISRGSVLLLKTLLTCLAIFIVSLAMITAAVKGG